MLQVALDNQTLSHAYETTRLIAEEVDIIEVGTILCVGEGVRAVRDLKALYPHKIVLADAKIADAGKILSRMCFEANADWVTVICCADINTAKGALDVAKEFNGDVQIELTGFWTWEQAQEWRDAGSSRWCITAAAMRRPLVWRGARRISAPSNVWPIWASK
jgi:3-dehydro-L-gulonate-6-phosphate decarboxylase